MEVKEIQEKDFKEVIKTGKVLIDCYATWCGPCKMLAPIVDEVAKTNDSCSFYKLDIDDAISIAEEYNVFSIPTLLLFVDGELVNRSVGFVSKEKLEEFIQ